jgi:hypothetical protein
MKNYHFDAPLFDVTYTEYFATEVVSIQAIGPCTRIVFATAKLGTESGRPSRESVCAVVLPTEMVAMFAEHIRTGIPARAQAMLDFEGGQHPH